MRLINVHTRLLEDFVGDNVPKYATLSHTWEEEEVTYSHYVQGGYECMKGYSKIDMTCRMAEKTGLSYTWVDTCCIDKSSSAELSEAINSMYRWYQEATVCLVYLSDLKPGMDWTKSLHKCRWFTRGWTLQELIAPHQVVFFDSAWSTDVESKKRTKTHLVGLLSEITRVDALLLSNRRSVQDQVYSVAQKMSWAARRNTTRAEDRAYSLLGLFDISMPLLYGEGERAFIRLQEEIMRSRADLSILAWQLPFSRISYVHNPGPLSEVRSRMVAGVLAQSPADFERAGHIMTVANRQVQEFSTTNVGIKLRTRIFLDADECTLVLPLSCMPDESGKVLSILLMHLGNQRYLRLDPFSVYACKPKALLTEPPLERYLITNHMSDSGSQNRWDSFSNVKARTRTASLKIVTPPNDHHVYDPWPLDWYDRTEKSFFVDLDPSSDLCCIKRRLSLRNGRMCSITLIALGWSDKVKEPQCGIFLTHDYAERIEQLKERARQAQYDRSTFICDMMVQRIPRAMSLHFPLSEIRKVAVISAHLGEPTPDMRRGRAQLCWKISFSTKMYPAGNAPAVVDLEWKFDRYR